MSAGRGIALTQIGACQQSGCRAPVFAELLSDAAQLCIDCAAQFAVQRASLHSLFERSGGRLPPDFMRQPFPPVHTNASAFGQASDNLNAQEE